MVIFHPLNNILLTEILRFYTHHMKKKRHGDFHVLIEKDEDGYFIAEVPELPGCHTQAKSLDQLMKRTQEAILLCLDEEGRKHEIEFVGVQKIAV